MVMQKNNNNIPTIIFLGVLSLFTLFVFVYGTIIPFAQMSDFSSLVKAGKTDLLLKKESKDFSPIIWRDIAKFLLDATVKGRSSGKIQTLAGLLDKTIDIYEDLVNKTPFYAYDYAALGQAYSLKSQLPNQDNYLEKAEVVYKKAIEIMPERQKLLYAYGLNLSLLKKYKESFDIYEHAYELSGDLGAETDTIIGSLQKIMVYYYEKQDREKLLKIANLLSRVDSEQMDLYGQLIDYVQNKNVWPEISFE